jgi:Lrp/AsnC family transcriptional regulator, leucine-responsive regulatory protein
VALFMPRSCNFVANMNSATHRPASGDDLDAFDFAILEILQRDDSVPLRTIGEDVNLSAAAVQRRIKRMRESGVIVGNIAVVDPARLGRAITILVEIVVESERIDLIEGVRESLLEAPEVQQCYYVTGEADFVVVITVATMQEYEALTRRLFFNSHNVKRFRTLVVMDRVKVGLQIPIGTP